MHYAGSSLPKEGQYVAVLVLRIDTGARTVVDAHIVGPNPAIHGSQYRWAEIARVSDAPSFEDAQKQLVEYVRVNEPWIGAILKIAPQPRQVS